MGLRGQKLGHTHCKVLPQSLFKYSYLNHRQVPFHTWNIIIPYHYLLLQNTIIQGQALGWGLTGKKLGYTP